ncbi:MAG: flagellin [Gammaproteobacteria bacterium]|nr:flagellin [Gammaproteobacteria bacterium]MBI5615820.1 flagellin [Gammaproteobacteria bacterium]
MPQVINTNILSLNALRNLNKTQNDLTTAIQRLSSGLRINSAKDDAAGIAVATRMTTQIGGLTTAIRNANDGISVSQTAEGAMAEMTTNLNRAHDLAVQAASYNTSTDRNSLNQEVSQILDEMSRIVNQTRFNGQKILAGGFSGDFQVGSFVNETINVSVSNMSPTNMGVSTEYSTVSGLTNAQLAGRIAVSYNVALGGTASLNGTDLGNAVSAQTVSQTKIDQINAVTSSTAVNAFGFGNGLVGSSYASAGVTATAIDGLAAGSLSINGVAIGAVAAATSLTTVADNLVSAINSLQSQTGVTAVKVGTPDGATATQEAVVLINRTGAAISLTANSSVDAGITSFFSNGTTSVSAGSNGAIVLNGSLNALTQTYDGSTTGASLIGISSSTTTLANAVLSAQSVTSTASANLSMLVFESALDTINSERSVLGAKLNRMDAVVRNLSNTVENITSARSRIQDADFAQETANMTKAQILQQAGVAMVAQANQIPQTVLSLLK